jgi:hypothetical protein
MTHPETSDVPVARLIGFEAKEIAEGILCDIANAAMGMAFASTLAPGESFTTIELRINFFRPV